MSESREQVEALNALFRENEIPISDRNGRLYDELRAALSQSAPKALAEMETRKDAAYLERNRVVAALAKCFPSGVARTAIEGWSEDWHGCVYIDLPTGQASWHFHDSHAHLFAGLPPYTKTWDGHDTPEKYRRLAALGTPAWLTGEDLAMLTSASEALIGFVQETVVARAAERLNDYYVPNLRAIIRRLSEKDRNE